MNSILIKKTIRLFLTATYVLTLCLFSGCKHGHQLYRPIPSALNAQEFSKYWIIEAEDNAYTTRFLGDTLEITSPKGLTLWRKEKMKGDITITYFARVMMEEGKPEDRLSDLNCFWKASDPQARHIWKRMSWRQGIFTKCYSLQLYYMGYGGNHNRTTRFRRYDGNGKGVDDPALRPKILKEYTDPNHLLKPNQWYYIVLKCNGNRIRYFIDDECLVDYTDPHPLQDGWFGFRTTWSRTQITGFTYREE